MFSLGNMARYVLGKETGPKALPTPTAPKHKPSARGDDNMPVTGNIYACGDSASTQNSQNWKSVGELARKLAEKLGGDV